MAIFEENGNLREPPGDFGSSNPDCLRYRLYRSARPTLHHLPDVGGVRLRGGRGSANPVCLRYRIYRSAPTGIHRLPDVITHQSMMRKLRRHLLPNWPGRNNQRTQSRNTGAPLARRLQAHKFMYVCKWPRQWSVLRPFFKSQEVSKEGCASPP